MTDRELNTAVALVELAGRYSDANPEVGFGPSVWTLARKSLEPLGFEPHEIAMVVSKVKRQ